ncbi:MAG: hypothetical protein V2J24_11550 [Pseudomonadales bacterium]|jgi:hypothetical protein|nr:hypothetical protein [Pseudomonadales bacterium]
MIARLIFSLMAVLAVVGCSSAPATDEAADRANSTMPVAKRAPTVESEAPPGQFPRTVPVGEGAVVVHAPQISSWRDFEVIEGIAALETVPPDDRPKRFAVMTFRATTEIDLEARMIELTDLEVLSIFENGEEIDVSTRTLFAEALPEARSVPLDLAISYLAEGALPGSDVGFSVDPPTIFVSQRSAVLVLFHGEPVLVPVEESGLQFVANTNWPVFHDPDAERWYLRNDDTWLQAGMVEGPWQWAGELPEGILNLPDEDDWRSTREAAAAWGPAPTFPGPEVFVATEPAELILLVGEPELEAVPGTELEYVTNTESPLFRHEGRWYYLVSGRWFAADRLTGDWTFAAALPEDFSAFPEDHVRAAVRVAVPGTPEATMAAIEAQLPRKTEVPNDTTLPIEVTYFGEPDFQPIEGAEVERAVNSPYQVILISDTYYLCYSGIWFRADAPVGPWTLATKVPTEVYDIPPSSPAYAVTDVKVYGSSSSTTTYGHSSGYDSNVYVYYGVPVYGTGWYYAPYYNSYYAPYYGYPVYYHHPYSYGTGSAYNPSTGAYASVSRAYGPYGGYGYASGYNPETGRYGRAEAYYDYDEWYAVGEAYNPRTNRYFGTERYYDASADAWQVESRFQGAEGGANLYRYGTDDFGRASLSTDGGGAGTFERRASAGGWDTSGSFTTADGRTLSSSGRYADGTGSSTLTGSEGGSGTVSRAVDGSSATREGTFTQDGNTVSTSTTRDGLQTTRTVESTDSGRGALSGSPGSMTGVAETASGDVYAARDGSVYRRTDEGWQKYGGDSTWTSLDAPGQYGAADRSRSSDFTGSGRRGEAARNYDRDAFTNQRSTLERDFRARDRGMRRGSLGGRGGPRRR